MKFIPRLYEWYVAAIALFVLLWKLAPQNVPVIAWKADVTAFAIVAAVLVEWRRLKKTDRESPDPMVRAACILADAIVTGCIIIGMTVGI